MKGALESAVSLLVGSSRHGLVSRKSYKLNLRRKGNMALETIIRIIAGVLFVVVLGVLVARRKSKAA